MRDEGNRPQDQHHGGHAQQNSAFVAEQRAGRVADTRLTTRPMKAGIMVSSTAIE